MTALVSKERSNSIILSQISVCVWWKHLPAQPILVSLLSQCSELAWLIGAMPGHRVHCYQQSSMWCFIGKLPSSSMLIFTAKQCYQANTLFQACQLYEQYWLIAWDGDLPLPTIQTKSSLQISISDCSVSSLFLFLSAYLGPGNVF